LFTDSVYVGKGMTEWMPKWKQQGWKRKEKSKLVPVKNEDLWKKLDALITKHSVKYTRVAGHSGHPQNDRCLDKYSLICNELSQPKSLQLAKCG
jgi:ribonuclease HI